MIKGPCAVFVMKDYRVWLRSDMVLQALTHSRIFARADNQVSPVTSRMNLICCASLSITLLPINNKIFASRGTKTQLTKRVNG